MRLLGQNDFLRISTVLSLNRLLGYHLKSPSKVEKVREGESEKRCDYFFHYIENDIAFKLAFSFACLFG